MSSSDRQQLLGQLFLEFRQMSAGAVMFHQAIAERLGLHVTDHKCADIIERTGPMTPGKLAQLTGLTTGAITGVIDRLEKRGLARRIADPRDRRRVIIELVKSERLQCEVADLFKGIAESSRLMLEDYTDDQLELLLGFVRRCNAISLAETHKLRGTAAADDESSPAPAHADR